MVPSSLLFLSTLPARGATKMHDYFTSCLPISIHAPREGSDRPCSTYTHLETNFYPRSPRGERQSYPYFPASGSRFLSTLPARGATLLHFYPRSPRGERLEALPVEIKQKFAFLSTLPARGATHDIAFVDGRSVISIHAPREGSDAVTSGRQYNSLISIHAPREGSDGQASIARNME